MEGMKNFQECAALIASSTVCGQLEPQVSSLTAPRASQGGHRTTLTCKKICIYILVKKILYAKLIYCDYPNKNVKHPDLKITKIWVQQK